MNTRKKLTAVIATLLPVLVLTGCATFSPKPVAPDSAPTSDIVVPAGSFNQLLAEIPVAEDQNADAYDRDLFNHWITQPSGCTTREVVLQEENVGTPSTQCSISNGSWVSAYDGVTSSDAGSFDIDHMVPLSEAWRSGAYAWDDSTREAYANDLGYKGSLVAVTANSNRSKSDKDPANWMPDINQCSYVATWVAVKWRWNLNMDPAEKQKVESDLAGCGDINVELPQKASAQAAPAPVTPSESTPMTEAPPVVEAPAETSTAPVEPSPSDADPNFSSCKEAKANGFGPYVKDVDPEYSWYKDGDKDGTVCE